MRVNTNTSTNTNTSVNVNGNGFWTTGNALFHAQFHSGIYYAKYEGTRTREGEREKARARKMATRAFH